MTEPVNDDAPQTTANENDAVAGTVDPAAQLQAELDDAKDRALRAQAELENVRKRLRREMDDERKYALMPLVTDLLPVVDNIARAVAAAEKSPEASGLLEGIKLVAQQLESVLARHNTTRIEAMGKPFDPNVHAAILQQPSADQPANTVLQVAQEGYQLHDRVVRPAQVIVSKAAE